MMLSSSVIITFHVKMMQVTWLFDKKKDSIPQQCYKIKNQNRKAIRHCEDRFQAPLCPMGHELEACLGPYLGAEAVELGLD